MTTPTVHLHTWDFSRIGRVVSAGNVERSYTIDNNDQASFVVSYDDGLIAELRPQLGRVVVIESQSYPYPWVGRLTVIKGDQAKRELTCVAHGYERILEHRYLGASFTVDASADAAIGVLMREVNDSGATGIRFAGGDARPLVRLSIPHAQARAAIDQIGAYGGIEWHLSYDVTSAGIDVALHAPRWRGLDRVQSARLVDGVTASVLSWTEDGEAAAYALSVVGGVASSETAVNDRPRAKLLAIAGAYDGPHGYAYQGAREATNRLTQIERRIVSQAVKTAGSTEAAAAALLERHAGTSRRVARVEVDETELWPLCRPGDVLHLISGTAFTTGIDAPVRVVGVQPDERAGMIGLAVEILDWPLSHD